MTVRDKGIFQALHRSAEEMVEAIPDEKNDRKSKDQPKAYEK